MFGSVAKIVMVFFSRVETVCALQRLKGGQSPSSNCMIYGNVGKYSLGMKFLVLKLRFSPHILAFFGLAILISGLFTFCSLTIPFVSLFAFFALGIAFSRLFVFCTPAIGPFVEHTTVFALTSMTIPYASISPEFGKRFDFFAMGTSLRYDFVSHFRFLFKREWLELVTGHIPVPSSLYFCR